MRPFTAAAVQLAPAPGPLTPESVAANLEAMVDITRRVHAATGAELIVLPESATTGFTPACSIEQLWAVVRYERNLSNDSTVKSAVAGTADSPTFAGGK